VTPLFVTRSLVTNINTCIHTYTIYTYVHSNICTFTYISSAPTYLILIKSNACIQYMHTHIQMTCKHTHVYTNIQTHIHTFTNTHVHHDITNILQHNSACILLQCITVFGKHFECIAQKCTHLEASHPLLVPYYCWVTVYSPGMEVKKEFVAKRRMIHPGLVPRSAGTKVHSSASCAIGTVVHHGSYSTNLQIPINLSFNSQLCWERKNSVHAENNESFIYRLFKLYVQV